jgi:hypothetical protein
MAEANADAVRLVKPYVENAIASAISAALTNALTADDGAIKTAIANAVGAYFKGTGDSLPASADVVGQLFVRTGATSPGLYVSTGTTTPGWKTVSHAS